jgi:putative resolvase
MKELVPLSKASKILGVTTKTLRNWDEAGKIKVVRTSGNHRRVPIEEIERIAGRKQASRTKTLVYCRCPTQKQQENLERQVGRVLEQCSRMNWIAELYKDIGSGLNENRKDFRRLLKRLRDEDVARVVVEYKDRIARYGFETFRHYCESHGVEVVILNDSVKKEFEEEMTEDIISLVASYSARMYGRRGGRKKS